MNTQSSSSKRRQVMMMPDYRIDNPYQTLLTKALHAEEVEVHFPWGYHRVLPIFRAIRNQKKRIDILHLHWVNPYIKGNNSSIKWIYAIKFLLDIFAVRLSGVRVVWTVHNLISHDSKFSKIELWVRQRLSKIVDRLIVHNYSSLKSITQLYQFDVSKATVISIGNYRDVYAAPVKSIEARKILGLPTEGYIYLWQGILRPYKGVETLIEAWANHTKLLTDHTLIIAGKPQDEAYGQYIESMAAQVERVHCELKFIEDEKIHLFYSAATVVVLPFKQILTSSSLVLAMSYAKPIIAPRIGGISETIGEANWLLYDPEDEQGLWHAIKDSTQVDLDVLGQLVSKMCDRLDWNAIAKKTFQIYQNG